MATELFTNNPAFLGDEELKSSFVVRQSEFQLLVELLHDQTAGANQHVLLVGSRGMGKTSLVRRLVVEITGDHALESLWFPIVFSEEIPAVLSVGELWLDAIQRLIGADDEDRWRPVYEDLLEERDEHRLRERALDHLRRFAHEKDRKLLLIVENMNVLLGEQLSDDDGWTLRHALLNEPWLMVIGTATTRFEAIDNVEKAMFDLFKIQDLAPLDADGCRVLYESVTGVRLEGRQVRPLQVWTGGNPRLITIMASFAQRRSMLGLMESLQHLIDDHTPYFKSNLEGLPVLERKIYVSLAELWDWATAREVATRARIDVNKASAYLGRLESRGAVNSKSNGRAKSYRVSERLFILYHLMRSRTGKTKRLQGLIDFMAGFYEPKSVLVRIAEEALDAKPEERKQLAAEYARIFNRSDEDAQRLALVRTPSEFLDLEEVSHVLREQHKKSIHALKSAYERVANKVDRVRDDQEFSEKREQEARIELRESGHSATERESTWFRLLWALMRQRRFDEAVVEARQAVGEFPESVALQVKLAQALASLGRNKEATESFETATSLKDQGDDELFTAWDSYISYLVRSDAEPKDVMKVARRYMSWSGLEQEVYIAWILSNSQHDELLLHALELLESVEPDARDDVYYCVRFYVAIGLGDFERALEAFGGALVHLPEFLSQVGMAGVAERVVQLAELGSTERVIEAIESSSQAYLLEPVVVALKLRDGLPVDVPLEIREVAEDVCEYLDKALQTSDD